MAARLAQLVERHASVAGVVCSNPTLGALFLSYFSPMNYKKNKKIAAISKSSSQLNDLFKSETTICLNYLEVEHKLIKKTSHTNFFFLVKRP